MNSVDLVIPVYNEEAQLAKSIAVLRAFLSKNLDMPYRIVVADNGSTDTTLGIAKSLSEQYKDVGYVHLEQKGRGRALRRAWLESPASIVSYMDVDLSTDLVHFPALVKAIAQDGYDIAIGSRLSRGSKVKRAFKREFISRSYNLMIKMMFRTRFSDAQCGFKAVSRKAAQELVPLIKDQAWFFDTELLLLATMKGYRIKEIPVRWIDDPDSRVRIVKTATEDIKGLLRLRFRPLPKLGAGDSRRHRPPQ